jgi:HlyD family secretion protein
MMNSIRDTSAQDTVLSAQPWWQQKRMWLAATVLIAALAGGGFVVQKWSARTIAVSRDSLGIATVTRGTLVRDIVVNGKLVAANSPALYSTTSATVRFKVKAGDAVRAGDVVAELDSPDLMSELRREEASLQQLEADIEKQKILARKQKLLAQRDADTAEIERLTAERAYQRIEQAGVAGVVQK